MTSQRFLEPPKNVGDSKINSRKLFDNIISTFYCWLYFPTSIVHNLDYLLTPSVLRVRETSKQFIIEVRKCFQQSKKLILLFKNHLKIIWKLFRDYLEIKTFEKFKFEKKSWIYPISWIENANLRGHRKLRQVSPGQRRQLLLLIFDILKRKIENLNTSPLKNWMR